MKWFVENRGARKILIICKKSIKSQWASELRRVAGWYKVPIYVTGSTKKKRLAAYEGVNQGRTGILITNYHNFLNILGGHLILILVNEELRFDGKPISHFNEWVKEHQVYPRKALKLGLEGRVSVCFTITEEGELADVKVLKGVHKVLDEASVRLIKSSSGRRTPATQSGFT
jgi:TonB family protein